jgi:hypothetical protein
MIIELKNSCCLVTLISFLVSFQSTGSSAAHVSPMVPQPCGTKPVLEEVLSSKEGKPYLLHQGGLVLNQNWIEEF